MKIILILLSCLFFISCGKNYTPTQKEYIASIEKSRKEKDEFMKNDPSSPFRRDTTAHFAPLKYFDIDPDLVFTSPLHENDRKDTVIVLGTKGEERKSIKYGYLRWNFRGKEFTIHVYKNFSRRGEEYYSIWFTDKTTGKETYNVGRYLDFEFHPDKNFIYTIDFNTAYNPWCSYSGQYSCAIPTKDDYLDIAVEAGEKKFH